MLFCSSRFEQSLVKAFPKVKASFLHFHLPNSSQVSFMCTAPFCFAYYIASRRFLLRLASADMAGASLFAVYKKPLRSRFPIPGRFSFQYLRKYAILTVIIFRAQKKTGSPGTCRPPGPPERLEKLPDGISQAAFPTFNNL